MLHPVKSFTVISSLPPKLSPLRELAHNLWWTWNLEAVSLFRRLDRDLWEETGHNPVWMLGRLPQQAFEEAAADDGFIAHMMRVYQSLNRYIGSHDTWFHRTLAEAHPDLKIAYFSAEFGITECMPMYSGGLGVLAGDHLKSASDLGLPLVAVGLLYQEGYFRQYLNADGWQQESYPMNDFHNMPLEVERGSNGEPIIVEVEYPGRMVKAQVWSAQVGRIPLYLLDTNLSDNRPDDQDITDRLYGGDVDMRIRQEIMLGIGGMRALSALGITPTVCHMNEGHSAFLGLERARMAMEEHRISFDEARELTAAGNIFTTHTPVPAGIDMFSPQLVDYYFGGYFGRLGLNRDQFVNLGRGLNPYPDTPFSMAVLAIRLAAQTNGVSRRHGEVARSMWSNLWPGLPDKEIPITSVTNGIHPRSWISQDMSSLFLRYLGPRWMERPEDMAVWESVERIPDAELWNTHCRRRERLVAVARERVEEQLQRRGAAQHEIEAAGEMLHPDWLTIGFARRFATYKRALLLFSDPDRLARLLTNPDRPVQIVFAGKAHPHDNPGKEFIRQLVHLARRQDLHGHVLFLEDYDTSLARYMVQGADVWLNTPRQGKEASGTSGMKAAANGAIHLSTLDGWWCEAYDPEVGWRIGSGEKYEDDRYGDEVEGQALYDLLEQDVVPLFYTCGQDGLPRGWIAKMKRSIAAMASQFSSHRMVREYAEELYAPAQQRYRGLSEDNLVKAKQLAAWLQNVRSRWGDVRILAVESSASDGIPVASSINISCRLQLGGLEPADVAVRAYYGPVGAQNELQDYEAVAMEPTSPDENGNLVYEGQVTCQASGQFGYTVRVCPSHPDLVPEVLSGMVIWAS